MDKTNISFDLGISVRDNELNKELRIENEYSVPKDEVWGAISLVEMSLLDISTFIQEVADYYKEGENAHNGDE